MTDRLLSVQTLIDFHTHAFPNSIASAAISKLSQTADLAPFTDGTLSGLKQIESAAGVTKFVVYQIATKPSQQISVNNWAAANQSKNIFFYGSVHPDADDVPEELERIKEIGLKGVKFHPDYQEFFVDEARMLPIYAKIESLGLPVAFHAGMDPLSPDLIHAKPAAIATIAKAFPKLTIIAAHVGGHACYDDVERHLVGLPNVYFDLAMGHTDASAEQTRRIVRNHGADHILFATDLPWGSPGQTLDFLDSLGLSDEENELICYKNAEKLLGL